MTFVRSWSNIAFSTVVASVPHEQCVKSVLSAHVLEHYISKYKISSGRYLIQFSSLKPKISGIIARLHVKKQFRTKTTLSSLPPWSRSDDMLTPKLGREPARDATRSYLSIQHSNEQCLPDKRPCQIWHFRARQHPHHYRHCRQRYRYEDCCRLVAYHCTPWPPPCSCKPRQHRNSKEKEKGRNMI